MVSKGTVGLTLIFISVSLSAEAARGGRAARVAGMADDERGPAASVATAAAAPIPPPADTAHFLVPFALPADFTFAFDVNDSGVVVGTVAVGDTGSSFLLRDGVTIVFDPPRADGFSELSAVNNNGDAVGDYIDADGIDRGFLRTADGVIVDLPDPVPNFTVNLPGGINSRGDIVGSYAVAPSQRICIGYLLRDGRYQTIDVPGATCVLANGINDHGDIVGNWFDAAGISHGFLMPGDDDLSHRRIVDITIAGFSTVPFHINNRREIVGDYFIRVPGRAPPIHGFVRREGEVRTLDDPTGFQNFVTGLNDGSVIAGFSGVNGGFLFIPKTAPSTHGD